jgi:hypothetical protein
LEKENAAHTWCELGGETCYVTHTLSSLVAVLCPTASELTIPLKCWRLHTTYDIFRSWFRHVRCAQSIRIGELTQQNQSVHWMDSKTCNIANFKFGWDP